MSANGSTQRCELLKRIADSRLSVIDETDKLVQNVQRQKSRMTSLKKSVTSLPVIATIGGVAVGFIATKLFSRKRKIKQVPAPPVKKSVWASLLPKLLLPLLLPVIKAIGAQLAKSRITRLIK